MNDRFRFRAWDKQDKELIYEAENTYDCQSYNGHTIWHDNFACLLADEERYTKALKLEAGFYSLSKTFGEIMDCLMIKLEELKAKGCRRFGKSGFKA